MHHTVVTNVWTEETTHQQESFQLIINSHPLSQNLGIDALIFIKECLDRIGFFHWKIVEVSNKINLCGGHLLFMCLIASSTICRLSNMTTPCHRLIRTAASEWWHELYDRALFTHSACIPLEPMHSRLGRFDPSQLSNLAFSPSRNWSSCLWTSWDSSLTSRMWKPFFYESWLIRSPARSDYDQGKG